MSPEEAEFQVLQTLVVPELQAEGYDVYLHPKPPRLPEFFGSYAPDAIALGAKQNLAVEVLQKSEQANQKVERIAAILKGHDDWALRIFWASPASSDRELETQHPVAIERKIAEIKELTSHQHYGPALLLGWATFEAAARTLIPEQFRRPQTPGRVVQVLAQTGFLKPSEADRLRRLADLRNSLIHGELRVTVSGDEVDEFVKVLEMLRSQMDLTP